MSSRFFFVAFRPGGSSEGMGGGFWPRLGQGQGELRGASMALTKSRGCGAGICGKLTGRAPRVTSASRQRNAFSILSETYMSCRVDLSVPEVSVVLTSATIAPVTPRSSLIAPRITSFTGIMSALLNPID